MDGRIGGHRIQEGDVIDALGEVGEQIADPLAALSILLEFPARFDDTAFVAMTTATECFDGHCLAIHADHVRFIVERIDVTWPAVHKQKIMLLALGSKCGGLAASGLALTSPRLRNWKRSHRG